MLSYNMTADEIMNRNSELAIIPVGSIEQHGPHLPVATDWYLATAFGQGIAEATGGFLLPALPISNCREHMGKKGSVWMNPDTFYHMLSDILLSIAEQGFKKAVTVQCHGGIFVFPSVIRQINATHNPDFMVMNVDIGTIFSRIREEGIVETDVELHAGEIETSLMLHIAPETVHMELAHDFIPTVPRSYLGYGSIFRASPTGVWGIPSKADANKGKQILERGIELSIEEMENAFQYMSSKEKFGYSNF